MTREKVEHIRVWLEFCSYNIYPNVFPLVKRFKKKKVKKIFGSVFQIKCYILYTSAMIDSNAELQMSLSIEYTAEMS